ncbi:MAG: hypothetical protein IIZ96_04240 [Oscillospiraceae bacterium]|nr:hypothetical protein [Oscillospiraceae bacterium]
MSNIFTRKALNDIMGNEGLTPEQRTEQVFSLYGRALDDGYIAKTAAQQAQQTALDNAKAEWEKGVKIPDPKESDDYKTLQNQFNDYKAMQQARTSEDYKGVKGKFFETVYGMVDRKDGAKPVAEQLADIRKGYEEYFEPEQRQQQKPTFGAPVEGSMPKGETGAVKGFADAWGFVPKKT